jgi:hypothetical protein
MSESSNPGPEIVASGREVLPTDVERLWTDLLDGRTSVKETMARTQALMDTVNVIHVANWGLSSLYHLTYREAPTVAAIELAHAQWQQHVREYESDPIAWDRAYYQQLLRDLANERGMPRAQALGAKFVATGDLRHEDVAEALALEPPA